LFEDGFAVLNWSWYVPEDNFNPNCLDGPAHSDYNFHEKGYSKLIFEAFKDLQQFKLCWYEEV